jgi:hypothetical protein
VRTVSNMSRTKTPGIALATLLSFGSMAWAASSPCDLNQDGVVNGVDVTLAVNMANGATTCSANVEGALTCGIVTVQRVINASLGQTCITYNTHAATLSWTASTSPNIQGYNIYRGTTSGGPYPTKVNTSLVTTGLSFTDSTVLAGQVYYYVATAVDISGNESAYSAETSAKIPNP